MSTIKLSDIEIKLLKNTGASIYIEVTKFGLSYIYQINNELLNKLIKVLEQEDQKCKESDLNFSFFIDGPEEEIMKTILGRTEKLKSQNYVFGNATDKLNANVYIALPQKEISLFAIEQVQNACGEFMEALGYELKQKSEPILGSFYQKLKFFLKNPKTEIEILHAYENAKRALEIKYLNLPNSESTEKLANAAANLINALSAVDEGVLRLGNLLVVKTVRNGQTCVLSETLSPELCMLFDKNPQLLNNPNNIHQMLSDLSNNKDYFREGDLTTIS
ncbi:MAG: hypothetical protein ACO1N9_04275 [Flavobacterium sp.]